MKAWSQGTIRAGSTPASRIRSLRSTPIPTECRTVSYGIRFGREIPARCVGK